MIKRIVLNVENIDPPLEDMPNLITIRDKDGILHDIFIAEAKLGEGQTLEINVGTLNKVKGTYNR